MRSWWQSQFWKVLKGILLSSQVILLWLRVKASNTWSTSISTTKMWQRFWQPKQLIHLAMAGLFVMTMRKYFALSSKKMRQILKNKSKKSIQGLMSLTMLAYLKLWRISIPTMPKVNTISQMWSGFSEKQERKLEPIRSKTLMKVSGLTTAWPLRQQKASCVVGLTKLTWSMEWALSIRMQPISISMLRSHKKCKSKPMLP